MHKKCNRLHSKNYGKCTKNTLLEEKMCYTNSRLSEGKQMD